MLKGCFLHNYCGVSEGDFEINFSFGDGHGYATQDGDGGGSGWNDDFGCSGNGFNGDGQQYIRNLIL
jgi:hypothetical protein